MSERAWIEVAVTSDVMTVIVNRTYPEKYANCLRDLRNVRSKPLLMEGSAFRVMSGVVSILLFYQFIQDNPGNIFILSCSYMGSLQTSGSLTKDASWPNGWAGNEVATPSIFDKNFDINLDATSVFDEIILDAVNIGDGNQLRGLSWLAAEPSGCGLILQVRSDYTASSLNDKSWGVEYTRGAGADQTPNRDLVPDGHHIQIKLKRAQAGAPRVWRVSLMTGLRRPHVRWMNLLSIDDRQKYKYFGGQTVKVKPLVVDQAGVTNLLASKSQIVFYDPSNTAYAVTPTLQLGAGFADAAFSGLYVLPNNAQMGVWRVEFTTVNRMGLSAKADAYFLVVEKNYEAPRTLKIGAMVSDFGFTQFSGSGLANLISSYRAASGVDIWKVALRWSLLEPNPGEYNDKMLEGLFLFLDAAAASGKQVQVGIQQFSLPPWINDGYGDYWGLQWESNANQLASLWSAIMTKIGQHAALHSVLVVNEQNDAWGGDVFIRFLSHICNAIRRVNRSVIIGARPNIRDSLLRTRYAQDGPHDIDYGTSAYPTFASIDYNFYGNPNDVSSYARFSTSRLAARATGARGGLGEIGWRRGVADTFTDADLTAALKRAMTVAYDLGYEEFMLWGLSFGYKDWSKSADLVAHRNALISRPRAALDFKVVIDVGDTQGQRLLNEGEVPNPVLNMADQPYAYTYQRLDELGLNWYYTTVTADAVQVNKATAQIALSELSGLNRDQQRALVNSRAAGIIPGGVPVTWPNGWN